MPSDKFRHRHAAMSSPLMRRYPSAPDSLSNVDLLDEKDSVTTGLLDPVLGQRLTSSTKPSRLWQAVLLAFLLVPLTLLLSLSYKLGVHRGRHAALPPLSTDPILGSAYRLRIQSLDDNFLVRLPQNKKFKGQPRPELDEAWDNITSTFHLRIHADEAKVAGLHSLDLEDGSGDVLVVPTVFHLLHCLASVRRSLFPKVYTQQAKSVEEMGLKEGVIDTHMDHCIDNIRQALMCQGDMSFYRFQWTLRRPFPTPYGGHEHRCVDWDRIVEWARPRVVEEKDLPTVQGYKIKDQDIYLQPNYSAVVVDDGTWSDTEDHPDPLREFDGLAD